MKTSSKKTQFYITLTSYIFLSFSAFCPIFYSKNPLLSLFFCGITAVLSAVIASAVFKKRIVYSSGSKTATVHKLLSIPAAVLSVIYVLLLMTEVIKDTCYIVGKGVSREYYAVLSIALLAASLYLCFNSEKGIYRFCFIGSIVILLFIIASILPFFTVKQTVFDFYTISGTHVKTSIIKGCIWGLFLASDTSVFLYCFKDGFGFQKSFLKLSACSAITAFLLWCIPILSVYLIFGKNLASTLSDPLYALTKVHKGFDITEVLSALRIFGFIIKSSVYVYSASECIKCAYFNTKNHALKVIIPVLFSAVPTLYLPFFLAGDKNSYGNYQNFIYPSAILLSLLFIIIIIFHKKYEPHSNSTHFSDKQ